MSSIRKHHSAEFKTKVALEAIRQQKTQSELTSEYGVHTTQINTWKKQALAAIPSAFSNKKDKAQTSQQANTSTSSAQELMNFTDK